MPSVAVSTALVESSSMSILGFFSRARAMHSLCFWPPETFEPPCSISESYPSGIAIMKPSAWATLAAWRISSIVAFSLPQRRFSATVPENSSFFCSTMDTAFLSVSMSYSRTSLPPTLTQPSVTS